VVTASTLFSPAAASAALIRTAAARQRARSFN